MDGGGKAFSRIRAETALLVIVGGLIRPRLGSDRPRNGCDVRTTDVTAGAETSQRA